MESDGKLRLLRLSELLQAESDELHTISITQIMTMMKERWERTLPCQKSAMSAHHSEIKAINLGFGQSPMSL